MVRVFSFVPDAESKLRCTTTLPLVHVLCNFVMTWRVWLSVSKVCLKVQIGDSVIVGQRVRYMMNCMIHAHDPSPEGVQAVARA